MVIMAGFIVLNKIDAIVKILTAAKVKTTSFV